MDKQYDSQLLKKFIVVAMVLFVIRLFYLQVIDTSYKLRADDNVIKKQTIQPSRGIISDRNKKVIVYNQAVYDIYVQINRVQNLDTALLCSVLGISDSFFIRRMEQVRKESTRKPVIFLKQVSQSSFAAFQEHLFKFPGFSYQTYMQRYYPYNGAAHIFGYISEVDPAAIEASKGYYKMGDYYGVLGIEKSYDEILRGVKGVRYQVVDVFNIPQGSFKEGKLDEMPIAGTDIQTTLDIDLQTYGEELMRNKTGSVVAIDPKTGEILAFISSPSYDPNMLTGRERGKNFGVLARDKYKPLLNRPIQATYPPGSTFKPIASLVSFQENIIDANMPYTCRGGYRVGNHTVKCHRHGPIYSVREAIKYSCNAYYCYIFNEFVGNPKYESAEKAYRIWRDLIMQFGFGHPLGIDIGSEKGANIPSADYYNRLYGKKSWKASTIISISIGQGEVLATSLQMANSMAVIANRGYYIIPHVVRGTLENNELKPIKREKITLNVPAHVWGPVTDGLQDVMEGGTGTRVSIEGITMCGKTGTAQNPHGKDHSMFVAFAPRINPKIAIAVVVENAGFGSTYAAPIASLMIEKYINDTIATKRLPMEERMKGINLHTYESPQ
jgi:penicillin-binding protein 2